MYICVYETKYSRMDQVNQPLKAVFHKFYLVHSWILWPICIYLQLLWKNQNDGGFVNVQDHDPTNIYLFKVNRRNWRKRCELYSKLTVNTPERHVIDVAWVSWLITLNIFHTFFYYFYGWLWISKCVSASDTEAMTRRCSVEMLFW